MSHSSGFAGLSGKSLPPPRGRASTTEPGAFTVNLGPTLWMGMRSDRPEHLMFGLLTHPPKPEGNHCVEMIGEGYARQPVRLVPGGAQCAQANHAIITFGPMLETWPKATHAAVFDAENNLLYYGAVFRQGSLVGPEGASPLCVQFDAHAIRVR